MDKKVFYIPTYKECREICDANDNFTFFETKHQLDGFSISIFSYRLAQPILFTNPIPSKPEITAHEMRGLTFVWNNDGSLFSHFLLMDKFFNLNQSDCSSYSRMKDEKIKEITYKEDGSILSFIKLPNGKILAKTKASFEADQAIRAQVIFEENMAIQKLVTYCVNNGIIPIFEFVGPTNRVVLRYDKTDLVLIKMRYNATGEYLSVNDIPTELLEGVTLVKTFNEFTLDDLIAKCETEIGYEGFVVTFESGKMIKLKLLDYIALHNLHTEDLHREDSIIYLIINEEIDDILCQLDEGDERRAMILDLIDLVNSSVNYRFNETTKLLNTYSGNTKSFVAENIKHPMFKFAMTVINRGSDLLTTIKDRILKETYFLMNARKWIENEKRKL